MKYTLPFTINSGHGEQITFREIVPGENGDKVLLEGRCTPGRGPVMHVHYMQDEGFRVVQGKLGYEMPGKPPQYANEGQSVEFRRNTPHRFWNAGENELVIDGWVQPANSILFFLTTLYEASSKSKTGRPAPFESAYLLVRYKKEYDIYGVPAFVKKGIMPITYSLGVLLGKYKKFRDAPAPLR